MNEFLDGIDPWSIFTWVVAAFWFYGGSIKKLKKFLGRGATEPATEDIPEEATPSFNLKDELSSLFEFEMETVAPTPDELRAVATTLSERVIRVHSSMEAPSVRHLRVHLQDCIEGPRLQLLADVDRYATLFNESHQASDLDEVLQIISDELEELDLMCDYLEHIGLQRHTSERAWLGDADALAESCYRPVVDFATAQALGLHTMHPVSLAHGSGLTIDLSFSDSKLAPLMLPEGFDTNLFWWPAVAHEIGHDFFHSVDGLRQSLFDEMALDDTFRLPLTPDHWTANDVHEMFGAWLEEIFCDLIGTLILGPAYVASMTHLFANPEHPVAVWIGAGADGLLGEHPPRHLRVLLCCEALDYLGQHHAAIEYLKTWTTTHEGSDSYYVPCQNGAWIGLPPELIETRAKAILQQLFQDNWEALEGYHLIDIPGFSYQHAEHAKVMRYVAKLVKGHALRGDTRLLVAAAVVATRAHPSRAALIRKALQASIVGLGTGERSWRRARDPRGARRMKKRRLDMGQVVGSGFVEEMRDPHVVGQAIAVGATFAPRRR